MGFLHSAIATVEMTRNVIRVCNVHSGVIFHFSLITIQFGIFSMKNRFLIVDFQYYFLLLKSFMSRPDCRMMERKVPIGISFLGWGTITVLLALRYFVWLPFLETNTKPFFSRILMIYFEAYKSDIDKCFSYHGFVDNRKSSGLFVILKIEF